MWYITEYGKHLNEGSDPSFGDFGSARERAEALEKSFGKAYYITKVQIVYATHHSAFKPKEA